MYCPRLDHFVRLNKNGSIGKCGHMTNAIGFETVKELEDSKWLKDIKATMAGHFIFVWTFFNSIS